MSSYFKLQKCSHNKKKRCLGRKLLQRKLSFKRCKCQHRNNCSILYIKFLSDLSWKNKSSERNKLDWKQKEELSTFKFKFIDKKLPAVFWNNYLFEINRFFSYWLKKCIVSINFCRRQKRLFDSSGKKMSLSVEYDSFSLINWLQKKQKNKYDFYLYLLETREINWNFRLVNISDPITNGSHWLQKYVSRYVLWSLCSEWVLPTYLSRPHIYQHNAEDGIILSCINMIV